MHTILTVTQLFLALGLIGLVLIQHGRGADAGAAFGSGASSTVFGSRGSGSFLSRATAVIAALFFVTSIALGFYSAQAGKTVGIMEGVEVETLEAPVAPAAEVPAVPAPAGSGAVPMVPAADGSAVPIVQPDVPVVPTPATPAATAADEAPSQVPVAPDSGDNK
jgi:preprotein translocase subunit SecG